MKNVKNVKLGLIIGVSVILFVILCIFGVQSSQNKAFMLEEQVNTAQSDIKVQEKLLLMAEVLPETLKMLQQQLQQFQKHILNLNLMKIISSL